MSLIQTLFEETTLGELIAFKAPSCPRELITVHQDDSLHACLQSMIFNKIASVPVLDDQSRVVGVVDMMDVCRMLVERLSEVEGWKTWPAYSFAELLDAIPISNGMDFSKGEPLLMSKASSSVKSIISPLCTGMSHYCVVRHDDSNEYGIISQVDIVSWLASLIEEKPELHKAFCDIPLIDELKNRAWKTQEPIKAPWTQSVFEILKLMLKENVYAVSLVDEDDKLQANFSATDLKHIDNASVSDLRLSAKDFLIKFNEPSLTPVSFLDTDPANLAESLMLFSGLGIHRIWLVDSPMGSKFIPTGVFTVTDVLKVTFDHFLC